MKYVFYHDELARAIRDLNDIMRYTNKIMDDTLKNFKKKRLSKD